MGMDSHDEYRRQPAHAAPAKDALAVSAISSSSSQHHTSNPQTNGRSTFHLNHVEIKLEAIDRIQTQVNLNRASLETNAREMKRANERIFQMEEHLNKVVQTYAEHFKTLQTDFAAQLASIRQQIATTSTSSMPAGERLDDQTLEIFTRNLSVVSDKANKVDSMELDIQLLKRRIHKMEEHINLAGSLPIRENAQPAPVHRQVAAAPVQASPVLSHHLSHHTTSRAASSHYPHQSHTVEGRASQIHPDVAANAAAWASVNQVSKRPHSEVVVNGSPKRPKLAPLEPRAPAISRPESEEHPRYRTHSNESYPESNSSAGFLPPGQHDHSEEGYSAHQQRSVSGPAYHHGNTSPSAIARGRGRGGRPRKYMHPDTHAAIASGWPEGKGQTMIVDGQMARQGPDGQMYAITESVYASGRRESLNGSIPLPVASQKDPYAHTKKTRTKPIRNDDGILIRKDGKPDMRSQSSAANLRKVHARKEEQRALGINGSEHSPAPYDDGYSRGGSPMQDSPSDTPHRDTSEMLEHDSQPTTDHHTPSIAQPLYSQPEPQKQLLHHQRPTTEEISPRHHVMNSEEVRSQEVRKLPAMEAPRAELKPEINGHHNPVSPAIKVQEIEDRPMPIATAEPQAV